MGLWFWNASRIEISKNPSGSGVKAAFNAEATQALPKGTASAPLSIWIVTRTTRFFFIRGPVCPLSIEKTRGQRKQLRLPLLFQASLFDTASRIILTHLLH
ncbi:MAG: hypothetical protein ACPL7M_04795, partial [Bryobacteraceae bacterium]